jgi:hypothetical protein
LELRAGTKLFQRKAIITTAQPASIILDSEILVKRGPPVSKKNLPRWIFLPTLIGISIGTFFLFYWWGISQDCKPGQVDGQCGLATGMGILLGAGAAITIVFVGSLLTIRRKPEQSEARDTDIDDQARK